MTTIETERVDRMRDEVMARVDADVRKRGLRARRVRTGLVAGAFVVVAGAFVGPLLQGIGSGGDSSDSIASGSADSVQPEIASEPTDGDTSRLSDAGGDAADSVAPTDTSAKTRETIVTGSVHVVTADPRESSSKLSRWVEGRGGRIDSRSLSESDGEYASLTVRVPADQVNATVDHLETYGKVDNVSLTNDDVTATVRDLEARISALEVSIARLTDIVADATSSAELITAEQALTDRQSQLEQLETERRSFGEQVDLATLSVDFSPKESADDVDPGGFTGGLVKGWNALVGAVNGAVELLGVLLPWLAVALALYLGYRVVRRARGERWN